MMIVVRVTLRACKLITNNKGINRPTPLKCKRPVKSCTHGSAADIQYSDQIVHTLSVENIPVVTFPFWSLLERVITGKLLTGKLTTGIFSTNKVVQSCCYGSFEYTTSTTMKSIILGGVSTTRHILICLLHTLITFQYHK